MASVIKAFMAVAGDGKLLGLFSSYEAAMSAVNMPIILRANSLVLEVEVPVHDTFDEFLHSQKESHCFPRFDMFDFVTRQSNELERQAEILQKLDSLKK